MTTHESGAPVDYSHFAYFTTNFTLTRTKSEGEWSTLPQKKVNSYIIADRCFTELNPRHS